jgi:hypothetical protein
MTTKPAGECADGANRRSEAQKAGLRPAVGDSATRRRVEQNLVRRFDPIASGTACGRDAAGDVISPTGRSWPRIFPGL